MIERKLGKPVIRVARLPTGETIYLRQMDKKLYYAFWLFATYRLVDDIGYKAPRNNVEKLFN